MPTFTNKASLSLRVKPTIKTPPRTTSLKFRQLILESPTSPLWFFDDDFEEVDLNSNNPRNNSTPSLSSVSTVSDEQEDIELEAVSNAIVTTLQLYRSQDRNLSSLSVGSASIQHEPKPKKRPNRISRVFSKAFSNKSSSSINTTNLSTNAVVFDDGREDLIYHGMPVTEIKSTLNPMIVSTEFKLTVSDIQLQKPEYAHIAS